MPFSRWSRPSPRPARHFRPAVLRLEDRTVPSGFGGLFGSSGPATHLQVIVPESTRAGQSFDVIVEALDASNQPASGYTGTVALSLRTPGTGAKVPGPYTFTAADHGVHDFHVSLSLTTPQTITATDSGHSFTAAATTNAATQVATSVMVETPETAATGVATRVEVEVLDQAGQVMRNFTGPVTVSSTDTTAMGTAKRHTAAASLPVTYTFTAGDHGEHTFLITVNATAAASGTPATVTATTTSPALMRSAGLTLFPPTTVTHLGLVVLPMVFSGSAAPVVVEALNASDQVVSGYTGTVSFSSSDSAAVIRATYGGTTSSLSSFTYTFTAADAGQHTFWVTFGTTGQQSLQVTDSANSFTDSASLYVFTRHFHWPIFTFI
jgi:hypothetical protein